MQLTYVDHSGFVLEGDRVILLFDFFRDTPDHFVRNHFLTSEKQKVILASHAHPDHFNAKVVDWMAHDSSILAVFSEDIAPLVKNPSPQMVFLEKGEHWQGAFVGVTAFGSTDQGISLMVETEGWRIFHAGDLNNWHWRDESTAEEAAQAEGDFLRELRDISLHILPLDLALFPVDPRQGSDFDRGACQFIDAIRPRYFSPMHAGGNYEAANRLKTYAEHLGVHFLAWVHPGESVVLTK